MKKKMILTFVFMILLPVLILVVSIYRETEKDAVDNMTQTLQATLERSGKDIAGMTDSVEMMSNSLFNDSVLKEYIGDKEEKDFKTMISQFSQLRTSLANCESVLDIYRVELYIDDRKMAAHEYVHFFPLSRASTAEWYQETLQQGGGGAWCKGYRNELMLNAEDAYLIPYRRIVHSGSNIFSRDGVLVMNLNENSIYRYLEDIPTRTTEKIYLLEGDGTVLSAEEKDLLGEHLLSEEQESEILTMGEGNIRFTLDGRDCTAVFTTMPQTGWILLDVIETDYILEHYSFWADVRIVFFVLVILTLFAAASFIVIHTFDKEMVRRITQMAKNLEQGEAPEESKIQESEIDRAERLVYEMIDNNKRLVEENYQAKLEERRVQLFALQAQINPHFLYNTLECINWMAFQRGADEISQAVTMLAKYFRLSLNKGREIVSIADEVELARTYLAIQNIRFHSAITVEIIMPENMAEYKIPKLVLQPFVENAAIHGILKKPSRSGKIQIHIAEEPDLIRIVVMDDGVGMSEERLREILGKGQNDHYGIYNAESRIRLYYGEEYGIQITSEKNEGTKVELIVGKVAEE